MRIKSRFLRVLLVLVLLALFVGYFTFSTFLFSPLEGDFDADVAALIPRDVDYFVAKAQLESDFDEFPHLAVLDRLEKSDAWDTFVSSPEGGDLERSLGLKQSLAEIEKALANLPIKIDPLAVFGGEDLAVGGYFRGKDLAQSDWAVYGRANWMGKLGVSLLRYPGLLGLEKQGLKATSSEGQTLLEGGQLKRPLYIARVRDVVIVGTSDHLVSKARDLSQKGSENSLLQSARYFDHIQSRVGKDDLELFVDVRKMLENLGLQGAWPDPKSPFFTTALLGRLVQAPACKEIIGTIGFDEGLELDIHGEFSSELITSAQSRVYRSRGFDRSAFLADAGRLAPADASLFVYLHGPIAELLQMVLESVEPAMRTNIEDAFRGTGRFGSLSELVEHLDRSLKNRLAIIVRENDYPPEMATDPESGEQYYSGPPNDGQPVFAVAVVTWLEDAAGVEELRYLIGTNGAKFGLQGREPGETGFWKNSEGGFDTREYWSPFIPGTGMISTFNTEEHTIVSNAPKFLSQIVRTHISGGSSNPRLSERPDFRALLDSSLTDANALVWFAPREATGTLRERAQRWAEENVAVNWRQLREQEEAKALPRLFPGKRRNELNEEEVRTLDITVDPILQEYGDKVRREQVPALMARKEREIAYLSSISAGLAMLKLDPKVFELSLRVVTPLEK